MILDYNTDQNENTHLGKRACAANRLHRLFSFSTVSSNCTGTTEKCRDTANGKTAWAGAAVRSLIPLLAAGGGAVFAVVLVLCLVGALLASPLGIFFSGGSSGGQQQTTTIATVVQELDQEYDARLDEIRAGASYDEESLIGSRTPWSAILAVYAVKTASDLTNGQEVVTMTDGKKALLKQVFWDMNKLSGFTSTVPGEGDDSEDTTTLYITVTAKTADELADIYGFSDDQRQQLAELLSDEYREMWNDVF